MEKTSRRPTYGYQGLRSKRTLKAFRNGRLVTLDLRFLKVPTSLRTRASVNLRFRTRHSEKHGDQFATVPARIRSLRRSDNQMVLEVVS